MSKKVTFNCDNENCGKALNENHIHAAWGPYFGLAVKPNADNGNASWKVDESMFDDGKNHFCTSTCLAAFLLKKMSL